MNPILLAAAAYLLPKVVKGKNTLEKLSVAPTGLKYDKEAKALRVILTVTNPTNNSLTITNIFLSVNVDGSTIGTIESPEAIVIPKTASKDVRLNVKFSVTGLAFFILKFVTTKAAKSAEFVGTAKVGGLNIPIKKTLPINFGTDKPKSDA